MNRYIIAADIGGSHISSMLINQENWKVDDAKLTITKTNSFGAKSAIIEKWAENLTQTAQQIPVKANLQIAIALPGPFDYERGIFQLHPEGKMGSLVNQNFKDLIAPYFKQTPIFSFENDAACFGLGEACFGVSQPYERSIGITLGTGVGSSFIANQTIVKSNQAIPEGGELYAESYRDGIADDYFSTRWFVQQVEADLGTKFSGVRELTEQASGAYLRQIFKQFTHNLYEFLLPYAQAFDAEIIVVGGNIAKAWNFFGPMLNDLFQTQNIRVQPSILNEKAIMLGAAKVFLTLK